MKWKKDNKLPNTKNVRKKNGDQTYYRCQMDPTGPTALVILFVMTIFHSITNFNIINNFNINSINLN
uniref:Uncharacterized protein n=1 Tax=Anopheles christyi TaxID=43041 RepID=A0A182JVF7_9DIPT